MDSMVERCAKAILEKVPLGYGMTKPEAVQGDGRGPWNHCAQEAAG